jgi:hypothetical protein
MKLTVPSPFDHLPCNHLGSIGLSQGLFTDRKETSRRPPWPVCVTWRLWACSQVRTVRRSRASRRYPALSQCRGLLGAPGHEVDRHGTDRTAGHKSQPHRFGPAVPLIPVRANSP